MLRFLRSHGLVALVLVIAALLYWKFHPSSPKAISVGYVADRTLILWNTIAEVRQPVGETHYGDRLEVLRVVGNSEQVRTASGTVGWVADSRQLMDSDLWGKKGALVERAGAMPVQARGRTKAVSNLRVEPGRDASRIFQFARGTPVLVLQRAVSDVAPATAETPQEEKASTGGDAPPKKEDWLLVMRSPDASPREQDTGSAQKTSATKLATSDAVSSGPNTSPSGASVFSEPASSIAGWVLARFIEFDLPDALKDYASSADMRVVAWFELNRVPNGSGGEVPQYLTAGTRGPEGQPCDFTMLRVYTWGERRERYETAYVESDLCGRLPIRVLQSTKGPEFRFIEADDGEERTYVMQQTIVRRVKQGGSSPRRRR